MSLKYIRSILLFILTYEEIILHLSKKFSTKFWNIYTNSYSSIVSFVSSFKIYWKQVVAISKLLPTP